MRRSVWAELCSTCRSIMHASELVKRCRDTVTPLRNLSLDKNDTSSSVANRSAARRRASRAPTMAAAAEIDTILSNVSDAVQAYAAGHHDAALRAAPAPAVPRPIWAQAPEEVEQLLAGAILRDVTGAALVAASPIIVQAPDAHGLVVPHVCIHTSAAGTALLAREVVQRFATEYLPRVGLPGYVAMAGGAPITVAFAFNGHLIHRVAVSSPGLFDDRTTGLTELAGHVGDVWRPMAPLVTVIDQPRLQATRRGWDALRVRIAPDSAAATLIRLSTTRTGLTRAGRAHA